MHLYPSPSMLPGRALIQLAIVMFFHATCTAATLPVPTTVDSDIGSQNEHANGGQITTRIIKDENPSLVSITAIHSTADENRLEQGTWRVTRTGSLENAMVVVLQIDASSTALAADWTEVGATFDLLTPGSSGTITIPQGAAFVDITLTPNTDIHAEASEIVRLNLVPDPVYTIGSPANATITIGQNDFVVINTNDAGEGSLREAITNSNNLGDAATIKFEGGVFNDANEPDIIELGSRLPSLDSQTTVAGPGAGKLIIRRRPTAASFELAFVFRGADVTLSGLTFSGGGGGIVNLGNLRIDHCTIAGNTDTFFGGILNNGTLVVTNSSISGNQSSGGVGGGIYNLGGRTLSVFNSTISGNSSKNGGAGISLVGGSTGLLVNSTVSGNTSGSSGAGILNSGALTVIHSTITGNSGTGQGGGIATAFGGSKLTLANSIVAGNTARISPDIETYNPSNLIFSNGANFIGDSRGAAGIKSTDKTFSTTRTTLPQLLAPLADHGGPTLTHALVDRSPAINAGDDTSVPIDLIDLDADKDTTEPIPFDQRGRGFARVIGTTVDIGSWEAFNFEPTITAATTDEDETSSAGLVISANPGDGGLTTHYKITAILNGTLYQSDGITSIAVGEFITKVQGAAGLKFLPAANLNNVNTASFGFSAQAAFDAADSGLRGTLESSTILVNSINDAPTVVAPGLMDQTFEIGSNLSVPLLTRFTDIDSDALGFSVLANSDSSKASGTIIGTDVALKALATGVTNITIAANDGLGGTISDTFTVSVGTAEPTPLQIGTNGTLNRQNGLFELTVNVTNTTPLPINGFRLNVNFSAYLAAYPSLRLYNATSPAGSNEIYVDYPHPVITDGVVSMKLAFYTSTRTFPSPFSPVLSVKTLAASQVPHSNSGGIQPRIVTRPDRTILLEFPSIAGHWYRVSYSSDMVTWSDSPAPLQAGTNRMQWIDSGPPLTHAPPSAVPSRYYRVNKIDAP